MVANFPRLGPRQDEAAEAPEMSVSMCYCFVEDELMDVHASNRTGRKGRGTLLFLLPSRSPVRVVLVGGVVARSELGVVWGTGRRCHVKHDTCIESCEGGTCSAKRDCESLFLCRPAGKKPSARVPAGLDGKRQQQTRFAGTFSPKAARLPGRIVPTREGHTPKEQQHTHH